MRVKERGVVHVGKYNRLDHRFSDLGLNRAENHIELDGFVGDDGFDHDVHLGGFLKSDPEAIGWRGFDLERHHSGNGLYQDGENNGHFDGLESGQTKTHIHLDLDTDAATVGEMKLGGELPVGSKFVKLGPCDVGDAVADLKGTDLDLTKEGRPLQFEGLAGDFMDEDLLDFLGLVDSQEDSSQEGIEPTGVFVVLVGMNNADVVLNRLRVKLCLVLYLLLCSRLSQLGCMEQCEVPSGCNIRRSKNKKFSVNHSASQSPLHMFS